MLRVKAMSPLNESVTTRQLYSFEMNSALSLLNQHGIIQKMSSGSAEIDSLIDGIQESLFYLFYSNTYENQAILDSILNRLLVGCILPKSGKQRGFESMTLLFNNIDYHTDKNKHQILNPEKIAVTSKYAAIEPKIVFKNLYVQTAYNPEHQVTVAQEIADKIESNPDIKLLVIKDLTKFFLKDGTASYDGSNRSYDANFLKKSLAILYRACAKKKVAIVATADCNHSNKWMIPKPIGGTYLKHLVNVIVHIKPNLGSSYYAASGGSGVSLFTSFKATMLKHPYQRTPKSTSFYAKRLSKRKNPMLYIFD